MSVKDSLKKDSINVGPASTNILFISCLAKKERHSIRLILPCLDLIKSNLLDLLKPKRSLSGGKHE